jgi:hypothetical protein
MTKNMLSFGSSYLEPPCPALVIAHQQLVVFICGATVYITLWSRRHPSAHQHHGKELPQDTSCGPVVTMSMSGSKAYMSRFLIGEVEGDLERWSAYQVGQFIHLLLWGVSLD